MFMMYKVDGCITPCVLKQFLFKVKKKNAEAGCFEFDPKSAILEPWRTRCL